MACRGVRIVATLSEMFSIISRERATPVGISNLNAREIQQNRSRGEERAREPVELASQLRPSGRDGGGEYEATDTLPAH